MNHCTAREFSPTEKRPVTTLVVGLSVRDSRMWRRKLDGSGEILDGGATKWQLRAMPDTQINPTAAALLGLLHEGPMTGGQLMAAAERRLGPYWSMTRSQVYRELPVLAELGYV